mmetsp:Transcript_27871/g.78156  ORF Transcript_27871/g.78156 Transcript_27871/m.78156 type:complete len:94 (-) Transcript_27871:135-416(-)
MDSSNGDKLLLLLQSGVLFAFGLIILLFVIGCYLFRSRALMIRNYCWTFIGNNSPIGKQTNYEIYGQRSYGDSQRYSFFIEDGKHQRRQPPDH